MKIARFLQLIVLGSGLLTLNSCKPKEQLPASEKEVLVPCSGKDYFTDTKFFRANSSGESQDQVTSKKKALTNARNELAQAINTTVKTVTDAYVNSREMNNKEQVEERFESLNREIVEQTLSGTRVICEKLVQTKAGTYKTYIAIELSANELVSKYQERLSKDERLKIDYDYEKFREVFENEMKKRGGN
ncbi:MAG: hypothetical protein ACO263_11230 [Cyclobacteriaceae bacterium]|jgi:hypothetical protein